MTKEKRESITKTILMIDNELQFTAHRLFVAKELIDNNNIQSAHKLIDEAIKNIYNIRLTNSKKI